MLFGKFNYGFCCMGTPPCFSAIFAKKINFRDFLVALSEFIFLL